MAGHTTVSKVGMSGSVLLTQSYYEYHLHIATDMIIDAYGVEIWHCVEKHVELNKWRDTEFYTDENFFDIVNVTLEQLNDVDTGKVTSFLTYPSLPVLNLILQQVLNLYGKQVLKYLRDESLSKSVCACMFCDFAIIILLYSSFR